MQYVLVTVDSGKPVMFAGTEEPAAFGELFSIGAIGGDKNKQVLPNPSARVIRDMLFSTHMQIHYSLHWLKAEMVGACYVVENLPAAEG